ncbi:ABC transporter substrate-binding protein [Actinomyces minihominis]|uniref:ABC transporter substrate-binding protein n=1 Tax=Actinomyces minihominis TaxID=2002838 RepID=UPI000C07D821|nr:extracellular solute-binding protein [Actinomyces minihominis]
MFHKTLSKAAGGASVLAAAALVLSACSSGTVPTKETETESDGTTTEGATSDITLTVATFNEFGYTDELLQEYMDAHPGVKVIHNRAATSDDARANYFQKLGKTGLADVEAVEVDWLPEVMQYADLLAPVPDDLKARWLDWKVEAATDIEGNLIGYGTDIGPEGVCYRADLFGDAGMPTDREEVAELLDGDWTHFFDVGSQYVSASGTAFYDSAGAIAQGMLNQYKAAFEDPETGEIIATTNPEVKDTFDQITAASATESAKLTQWSDDWMAGFANGAFAVTLCPGWFLGIVEGAAPDADWDIANVFPNGGGNWGGSYLTVPANGANVEAAQELASWLSSPETQLKAFMNIGTFPSQVDALSSPELLDAVNPFFNDAPIGKILSDRAQAVTVSPFKGPQYFKVMTAFQDALSRTEDGQQDPATSWAQFVSEVEAF